MKVMEWGAGWAVEARRKGSEEQEQRRQQEQEQWRQEQEEQRRQAEQGHNTGQEQSNQGKRVRLGEEGKRRERKTQTSRRGRVD